MNKQLLSLVLASFSAPATAAQTDALTTFIEQNGARVVQRAKDIFTPPFSVDELTGLYGELSEAAEVLKTVFDGDDLPEVIQKVVVAGAAYALPDGVEPYILPLISGPGALALIESAYRKWAKPHDPQPVTNDATLPAPDVVEGGQQE